MNLINDYLKYHYHNTKGVKSRFSEKLITKAEQSTEDMFIDCFGYEEAKRIYNEN
jgi:hypothetical protein